jgi:TPP-dependent pyruvate/acetoin dehydrogenase alpha subunit
MDGRGGTLSAKVEVPRAQLAEQIFETVARIRAAELILREHIEQHGFSGFWHPGIGQEGLQVGAIAALRDDDYLFQAHRGLGYAHAKGMSLESIFGDLLARTTGSTGGKGGGTVHFVDPQLGVMGQGGTLGSGFPLAVGAALSIQLLGRDSVSVVFFGEGASSRGTFYEAAIEASVWKLPVVFICENNNWAISARYDEHAPTPNVSDRAAAFGFPGVIVDGQDALVVYETVANAVARARRGEGPTLIEAMTLRTRGHYEGDRQKYRSEDEVDELRGRDPIDVLRPHIKDPERVIERTRGEAQAAFDAALAAPEAPDEVAFRDVWVP